jgi:branched-chain amino acid transport system substrate-binding protein
MLDLDEGALDAARFERLARAAREREQAGELEAAAALMREALGLWRGHALAGLELEGGALSDIARLEELRFTAELDLVDYELALGEHERLVAELERLVAQHPLDERLHGQLIVALYRSGRQAEALQAYRATRETLVETLGIEPSRDLQRLERGILNHDPALQTPAGTARRNDPGVSTADDRVPVQTLGAASRTRRTHRWLAAALAAALAVAAAGAAVGLTRGGDSASTVGIAANSLAAFDQSGRMLASAAAPGVPAEVGVGAGVVWVASTSGALSRISVRDLRTLAVTTLGVIPAQLLVSGRTLWASDSAHRRLVAVDPVYGTATHRIVLARTTRRPLAAVRMAAAPGGGIWVTDGGTHLLRYDNLGELVARLDLHRSLADVATERRALWVLSSATATLFERDARSGAPRGSVRLESHPGIGAPHPFALAVGAGAVWVLNASPPVVLRVDPRPGAVTATIPLGIGSDPVSMAAVGDHVWVANSGDGTLARIDSVDNSIDRIVVGGSPFGVAATRSRVWLTVQRGLVPTTGGVPAPLTDGGATSLRALPASTCSPVYAEGKPDVLIAADLPLTGFGGSALTLQMSNAIRFVLAAHHYRAGRFAIGYQLCDDSSGQTGSWTSATCRANAHTISANNHVIGLIGPYNSGCAQAELPILAHAHGGALATVSPSTTYVGLTHRGPGTAPEEPAAYRANNRPTFARIVPADDVQGAANALLAKRLGIRRLVLLDDGGSYGKTLAAAVRAHAETLGIRIVGALNWTAEGNKQPLARRVAAARPDGIFLGGSIDEDGRTLLEDLRTALGPRPRILLPDGFMPFPVLLSSGIAAEGATVTFPGPAPSRLPAAGRRFVDGFTRAIGTRPEPYSITAAQAAEAMLNAIANSDGTRASVAHHLVHDPLEHSILGDLRFDRNGDPTQTSVSIFRIIRGQPRLLTTITPNTSLSTAGAVPTYPLRGSRSRRRASSP